MEVIAKFASPKLQEILKRAFKYKNAKSLKLYDN